MLAVPLPLAAVAKPLAQILADQAVVQKSLVAVLVAMAQAAVQKSLLAIHVQLLPAIADAALANAMAVCSASCSSTGRLAMQSLAMRAQPLVARPVAKHLLL